MASPYVGIIAGFSSAIHRIYISNGLGTSIPCAIATCAGGLLSAIFYYKTNLKNKIYYGFCLGLIIENLSMFLILIMSKDYLWAKNIVSNIYVPMVFTNAIGISILILIVQDIIEENELSAGKQAKLALDIANQTLPYFRNLESLESNSLNKVCNIIALSLGAKATVITDREKVIASFSAEKNQAVYSHIRSENTKKVLKTGEILVVSNDKDENIEDFSYISDNIKSCIILPLHEKNIISGTLKIFFDTAEKITEKNRYLIIGLSNLISTQMEISKIEKLLSLVKYSELKALQSQINPHFLFNALNTLASYIRTKPEKARDFIIDLSNYLRYNLNNGLSNVELIKELQQINSYLRIEKARFGEKLNIIYEIDDDIYNIKIPSLIIQPLVENSVKHGLLKKREGGFIKIVIKKCGKNLNITIEDNGVGIEKSIIDSLDKEINENIGLKNVHQRLKLLYGEGLKIEKLVQGTKINFTVFGDENDD
ncbi:histidine kinase [Fusobacterium russii]|uniref:histidine kinase n=1 Tax=Fusobacterium russii TaxID=854 RepID=UPI0003A9ED4D|nr:histidine kinase [Fusobacterium russii]